MSNQAARLKALRQKTGLNQQQVADKIGKSRPRIAIYETQPQVRIPADVLQKLAKLYRTTPDYIENGTAPTPPPEPAYTPPNPYAPAPHPAPASLPHSIDYTSGRYVRPVTVAVDRFGRERAVLVPVKAQAGYLSGYGDPEFIQGLHTYSIPGCEDGTYRIFEVAGDSMLNTLRPGDLVVARYVEDWRSLKHEEMYVIVSADGIVVKRVRNMLDKARGVMILSDNPLFEPDFVPVTDILEVWEAKAYISRNLSRKTGDVLQELNAIKLKIEQLNSNGH